MDSEKQNKNHKKINKNSCRSEFLKNTENDKVKE